MTFPNMDYHKVPRAERLCNWFHAKKDILNRKLSLQKAFTSL